MARVLIVGEHCTAHLTEQDEDGDQGVRATCGWDNDGRVGSAGDMVAEAEVHVDACPWDR